MPADEQAKFNALYERDGEERARALARFGIDGMPTYRLARSIAAQVTDDNSIRCSRDPT